MTVDELITYLENYPKDTEIWVQVATSDFILSEDDMEYFYQPCGPGSLGINAYV